MKKLIVIAIIVVLILANCFVAIAAIREVPTKEYPTVQSGVNAAQTGDTVFIRNGVYQENVQLVSGRNIEIIGESVQGTIIDGRDDSAIIAINNVIADISHLTVKSRMEYRIYSDATVSAEFGSTLYIKNVVCRTTSACIVGNYGGPRVYDSTLMSADGDEKKAVYGIVGYNSSDTLVYNTLINGFEIGIATPEQPESCLVHHTAFVNVENVTEDCSLSKAIFFGDSIDLGVDKDGVHLKQGSPLIDAGVNSGVYENKDIDEEKIFIDGNKDGYIGQDIGVDEYHDQDEDGVADWIDNCVETPNAEQKDLDNDGFGDSCDKDIDGDGFISSEDCNDEDARIYPGAEEVPNDDVDNNCNGNDSCSYCPAGKKSTSLFLILFAVLVLRTIVKKR